MTNEEFNALSPDEQYQYNQAEQEKRGAGTEDFFTLTEPGFTIEDTNQTLREWDEKSYEFQKQHGMMLFDRYDRLFMQGDWFRILEFDFFGEKKRLTYGTLISARVYATEKIHNKLLEKILDKHCPCGYFHVYGEPLFKKIPGTEYSEMPASEKRCAGREKERDIGEKILRRYWDNTEASVVRTFKDLDGYTFRKRGEGPAHDAVDFFIIGGLSAAKEIKFKTFMRDFTRIEQPLRVLENKIDALYKKLSKQFKRDLIKAGVIKKIV